ncbi:MAG: hypothetical protein AB7G93_20750 [Bdellovibrionales bacterium]
MRRILLVNWKVQMRIVLYGIFVAVVAGAYTLGVYSALQRWWLGGSAILVMVWIGAGIILFGLIVVLGLVISGQIAGPLMRLHRNLKTMRNGQIPELIRIRPGDAYVDLFADYNEMVEKFAQTKHSRP